MTIFEEILKASRNNQACIFAFTFKIKYTLYKIQYTCNCFMQLELCKHCIENCITVIIEY